MNREHCLRCPLDGISVPCEPMGDIDAPYMIVSDTPSKFVADAKQLLSKSARKVLGEHLIIHDFTKEDFQIVPQIRCPHEADTYTTAEKKEIKKHCRAHLLDEIQAAKPQVIIPLGADAASQVLGRAVKITKVQGLGEYSEEHEATVVPLLSPGQVSMYPQYAPAFAAGCATLRRLITHEFDGAAASAALFGKYQIVEDLEFLIRKKPMLVVFDTETTGLEYFKEGPDSVRDYDPSIHDKTFEPDAAILTMQFCIEPGKAYMLVWDHPEKPIPLRRKAKLVAQLKQLLCRPGVEVVGQNIKYDNNFLYSQTGIRFKIGGDTLMLAAIMDENALSKGQDAMVKQYVHEMAGYADCVAPDTEILLADMRKVRADTLQVGDVLCAFTADTDGRKAARRKMARSTVTGVQRLRKLCVEIETLSGRRITVSNGHLMLSKLGEADKGGGWRWRKANDLTIGTCLKPFPWEDALTTYDAGYVSGILDGEGWLQTGRTRVGIAQKPGEVLENTRRILAEAGVVLGHSTDKRKEVEVVNITMDGMECIKVLQMFRPRRLLSSCKWEGAGLPTNGMRHDPIVRITNVGMQEVVGLRTSTQTIISNGLCSHNSFNATTDKSRMWEVPLSKMLNYGCGDVDSCYRLYQVFMDKLDEDARLTAHYNYVSLPGLNVFAAVETIGIEIDDTALTEFEQVMAASVAEQYQTLIVQVPKAIKRVHIDKGLEFSRPDFVRDILFNHRAGFRLRPRVFTKTTAKLAPDRRVPSTSSKDHLPYFYDECPFTMQLSQYVKDDRLLGTNVRGFRKKYIRNGKVRPTYSLHVTVTGRTASEAPNGQNFPKRGINATAYRRIFIPPPGYYVLEADLSQAELRISADMANDRTMIEIYQTGGDIHIMTALIAMEVTLEQFHMLPKDQQKLARSKAKAINFGFIYGMGWRKFIGYAKTQYGVEFTEREAQRIRTQFFEKYYALPDWHNAMRAFAQRHKFVRSYSGRIRHLPMIDSEDEMVQSEAGRQAINSPVQGFGSDLGVMACGRLHEEIDPRYLAPIAFVHDAIYCYVPEKYLEWGAKTLKWYMESNDIEEWFGVRMKVPIVADVSFGKNFGDTHEMSGLSLDAPYDFSRLWDEEKQKGIKDIVRQFDPPRGGLRRESAYTIWTP